MKTFWCDFQHSFRFEKILQELPEFKEWLTEGECPGQARCTACNKTFAVRKTVIVRHSKSKNHRKKCGGSHLDDSSDSSDMDEMEGFVLVDDDGQLEIQVVSIVVDDV